MKKKGLSFYNLHNNECSPEFHSQETCTTVISTPLKNILSTILPDHKIPQYLDLFSRRNRTYKTTRYGHQIHESIIYLQDSFPKEQYEDISHISHKFIFFRASPMIVLAPVYYYLRLCVIGSISKIISSYFPRDVNPNKELSSCDSINNTIPFSR